MGWRRTRRKLWSRSKNAAYALEQALDIFNRAAVYPPVPGLQAGVSCLLAISRANAESIRELTRNMNDLTETVNKYTELNGQSISPQVELAVNERRSWDAINDEAVKIELRRKLLRVMDNNKDRGGRRVAGFLQDLSQSIKEFMRLLPRLIDSELFHRHWERLPTELHDYIYGLLHSPGHKTGLSALSLVSHTWSQRFRLL
ncbi:uncharacterized protein PHACADRAFT_202778 [Phanerochaete carnosa HHB-10118-sp]|uniref:Uncharacterized protein n=1 Tax=Phanerochaete carnosa (strain HHB-10118-sp) TaxID=650164 RepID=K5VP21_PHACS|nr:uncharacterized protein PHACADRAFT_202778 [Phanerochaete carnosa HHB-10118-sp]EKM48465.1 hypothetical protein PHACADRAFT_202778 [Phanerochaete carnosa HHB-10118-sp]